MLNDLTHGLSLTISAVMSRIYNITHAKLWNYSIGTNIFVYDSCTHNSQEATCIIQILIIRLLHDSRKIVFDSYKYNNMADYLKVKAEIFQYFLAIATLAIILYILGQSIQMDIIFTVSFIYVFILYLERNKHSSTINYGTGMAFSFFEGYLVHVLPSDGVRFVGFEENLKIYEAKYGCSVPVKRLFIIITKSLMCPPTLDQFNKVDREDLPFLQAGESLDQVEKDVAGVKNRIYKNSAYKIIRPNKTPIYIAAECATPLHTLYRVLQKKSLHKELTNINVDQIVEDFSLTLQSIIRQSEECKNKCEVIYYDDTDPDQNLADVLLTRTRELNPSFE